MSDYITDIKKRAGLLNEGPTAQYELHQYNVGNSRPFVMVGDERTLSEEVRHLLEQGEFERIEIVRKT